MDEEPIDPYDLADPVDITSKLAGNFFELLVRKKKEDIILVLYGMELLLLGINKIWDMSFRLPKNGKNDEKR